MSTATLTQRAYEHIQNKIFAGSFKSGKPISEAELAKELGVSRTPVGEALRQLAQQGLVEQVPRYGTIIRQPGREEIIELYELREGLEAHAVGLAVKRIMPAEIAHLERLCEMMGHLLRQLELRQTEALDGQPLADYLAADMAFHAVLIRASGNARIAKIVRDSHVLTKIFRRERTVHDRRVVSMALEFHVRILAAVKRGDVAGAKQAAAEHIQAGLKDTLENLDRRQPLRDELTDLGLTDDARRELSLIESQITEK